MRLFNKAWAQSPRTGIKKTLETSIGLVSAAKTHCLNHSGGNFRTSPYLQELACYLGQDQVFDRASETLEKLLGIEMWGRQIDRISHYYGERIGEQVEKEIADGVPPKGIDKSTTYYGMIDGGYVFTREQRWMEMKIARFFPANRHLPLHQKRKWIDESLYVAHLGTYKDFFPKVEQYADEISDLVFVNDGASWIWNWVEANYPNSTQILDFYHAKEHLCNFANEYFSTKAKRSEWIDLQTKRLLDDEASLIIADLKALLAVAGSNKATARDNLINYYQSNLHRMCYKTYREKGLMIGSGPIEAAHRHLIQQRMKLSGQRWTIAGAQKIVNLRVAAKSNHWHKVVAIIKNVA